MGYYMRYVLTDERSVGPGDISAALASASSPCVSREDGNAVVLALEEEAIAVLELNADGDELFEEERDEFLELIEDWPGHGRRKVAKALRDAKAIVAIQILFSERDMEETLELVDPLLEWLVSNRSGLLQVDGEGFYEGRKLILTEE